MAETFEYLGDESVQFCLTIEPAIGADQAYVITDEPIATLVETTPAEIAFFDISEQGPPGTVNLLGKFWQDDFVVTSAHIVAGGVTLSRDPAQPNKVRLIVYGGLEQRVGVDYFVHDRFLDWNQLGFEQLAEVGTTISVHYLVT